MKLLSILLLAGLALASTALAVDRPGPGPGPLPDLGHQFREWLRNQNLPEDIKVQIESYQDAQKVLRESLAAEIAALEDRNPQTVREATKAFIESNQDAIEAQKELAKQIRDDMAAYRLENAPERPTPPAAVVEAREEFAAVRQEMAQAHQKLRTDLAAATTEEEKQAILKAFREQQKTQFQEIKEIRRQLHEDLRDGNSGERRGGHGG